LAEVGVSDKPDITVEFYGMPRLRAGTATLNVRARDVGELLTALDDVCPELGCLVETVCRLNPQYLLSINGHRFSTNLQVPLRVGDRVLLLSADAGG
jgi:molybdopterin converting factor small subunit